MPKILNTDGNTITSTTSAFERYDIIRYSLAQRDDPVSLVVGNRGALDLARELGTVSAFIMASDKGNRITLGSGADTIYGGLGDDSLSGAGGDDRIYGMLGDDVLFGAAGSDRLEGSAGEDRLFGGAGNDVILDSVGMTTMIAAAGGADFIDFSKSSVQSGAIDGGAGYDMFAGSDNGLYRLKFKSVEMLATRAGELLGTIRQFKSFDQIAVAGDATDLVNSNQLRVTDAGRLDLSQALGPRSAILTASAFGNTLITGSGDDYLIGREGDDTLVGGLGEDLFYGRDGNDVYVVGEGDFVYEQPDQGIDTVRSSVRWEMSADLENLVLTGRDKINGFGNELDNILTGNSAYNYLNGLAGFDTLIGGRHGDYYELGDVSDVGGSLEFDRIVERADGGKDTVSVSSELGRLTYVIDKNIENAVVIGDGVFNVVGNALDNEITGNMWSNMLNGGGGGDIINGQGGFDTLIGGKGDDTYRLLTASLAPSTSYILDEVLEQPDGGIDTVLIGTGGDFQYYVMPIGVEDAELRFEDHFDLIGNSLANRLTGNSAENALLGLGGNDVLDGAGGQNALIGGTGNDRLISHGAADRFVMDEALNARTNVDRIIGFGDADTIELDVQVFDALSKGTLLSAEFRLGEDARGPLEHIIFNRKTGSLYYDEDGSGAEAKILFARLDRGADLSASDFLIV
ncbi:hypothetical protein IHQ71_05920 [Rhizobium sp. TH2]|uniref:calcium-binding protein n=1 Tax=Rhizobium sp. TH2 TaxID=2775403 RepID=UPI0021583099|nr:calcium-binding protein [Rhizobium sp. TH2]UVC10141.1 hypothetical protein IHQ71_05920 [Rhizobium sp. TH2]